MIFDRLFKKDKDSVADQATTQNDDDVQATALREEYGDDAAPLTTQSARKTKQDKKNTALGKRRKRRSNRTVHTKRSFHRKVRSEEEEAAGRVNVYDVIEQPVITEKAANQSENRVYAFLVRDSANKHTVADAIEVLYGVRPTKVRIAKRPSKKKRIRIPGREREHGMTAQKKKAYVFLREGDTIKLT